MFKIFRIGGAPMSFIFSVVLFAFFVLAAYFVYYFLRKRDWHYLENRMFITFCIASALWSLGFSGVFIQTVPDNAYLWRGIGMIGTFGYMITAQMLICYLSGIAKKFRYLFDGFAFLGIIIYFFIIQKDKVTYTMTDMGMTYSFNPGLWNNLYTSYSVIVALNMLCVIIYMLKTAKKKRLKELAKRLLWTEIIIGAGMVLDTIFPLIGMNAIPGSSISQFLGLAVMYHSMIFIRHSRINISNMSEFIYYSLKVPVLVYDAEYKLEILNNTAYSFLGVDKSRLGTVGIDGLFEPKAQDIFTFEGKTTNVDAICCHNKLYCELSINKIYDDYKDVIGYIIIVTDLSERMIAMEKLEDAKLEAEYANKAKSTFLANMSHEIRTPMNAIMGFSELLLKMDIDEDARSHVEDIKWSSHNLLAIINDILDISKIESGKMELVPDQYFTVELLNDISLIITEQSRKKNLAFNMKVDTNIPKELYGDKVRLRSVLINILNNAVKYTKEGSISFNISILQQTDEQVSLEFKVTDTGIGIRQEDLQKLFNSFERLDQRLNYGVEGSGLGLSIANGYVKLMGGNIKVDSVYGEGTTFTITLSQKILDSTPIAADYARKTSNNTSSSISDMKLNGITALVVDDNIVNLRVAQGILAKYGLALDTTNNGADSITMCKEKNYDLIFMDQMMPEMDGTEAMQHIRQINAHYAMGGDCKIIVLTADAIKGARETLMNAGFDEYLGKPINFAQLERLLLRYIPAERITYKTDTDT